MPKLLIVADAFGPDDDFKGGVLRGSAGFVFDKLLAQAGIVRSEVEVTALFPFYPDRGSTDSLFTRELSEAAAGVPLFLFKPKTYLRREHGTHYHTLQRIIREQAPNCVLTLGPLSLWVLTGKTSIDKNRGAPMLSRDGQQKIIATYHPNSVIRNWSLRPIVLMDFIKALRQSADPRLVRPRRILHLNPSLTDIEEYYHKYICESPLLSIDVETKRGQITEVGIASSRNRALVIPFYSRGASDGNYWPTARQERQAWDWIARIMAEKKYIGQNFQYDMQYFYRTQSIPSPGFAGDTMLLHHSMQPEMEKGLGFLGSIYTDEPAWKFMRLDAETLKKED